MLLLCAVFLLPIIVVTSIAVVNFRDIIQKAEREHTGSDYLIAMLPVMRRQAAGGVPGKAMIAQLDAATSDTDAQLGTGDVRQQWLATAQNDPEARAQAAR
ncbi:MAG: Methyl-accepting chemotaxis protein, partial [Rhizorhabdus sp.]|nr:Methyl-accepting chemotaxis protein [Rhizorhabdus sp.]